MKHPLLQRAQLEGTPLIEDDRAIFIWQGEYAPYLIGDFSDWERGAPFELERLDERLWGYQLELPADAYIEYAFMEGELRLPDPFNFKLTPNGVGKFNHYFYMSQGAPTDLFNRQRGTSLGTVSQHVLSTSGLLASPERTVYLYQPVTDQPCPLVVVWDGEDYFRRARLPMIVDNLVAQGRICPLALALVDNGGDVRFMEYACSEANLIFLFDMLLPLAYEHLNLLDLDEHPGAFGVLGASMGGLMALYTALRLPKFFGKALSQSGAFSFGDHETVIFDLLRGADPQAIKVWMDAGLYDFKFLLAANRSLHTLLDEHGFDHEYREYSAGHNYPAWRDDVWRGLEYLFPA